MKCCICSKPVKMGTKNSAVLYFGSKSNQFPYHKISCGEAFNDTLEFAKKTCKEDNFLLNLMLALYNRKATQINSKPLLL